MDFQHVKQLILPEGPVKELRIGGITVWRRPSTGNYSVAITTDNSSAITGAKYKQAFSKTFTAEYNVPSSEQDSVPVWTVSGLPTGMSAESLNGDNLTISGTPNAYGDFTLTVSVTKGSYTDSKQYTLTVAYVAYGVSITTSNASNITDFYQLKYASRTFSAAFNVPPANKNDAATWTISGLPSGLSASGATVSGYADNTGTYTVTVKVTKAGYSDTKQYTFVVEKADVQLQITSSYLNVAYSGSAYSSTVATNASSIGVNVSNFSASGLPSGLSINSSGVISGTPSNITTTTYSPTFYAVAGVYKSPAKTLSLTSYGRIPLFADSSWSSDLNISGTISAASARSSVGSVLWSRTGIRGQYFGEVNSIEVISSRYYGASQSSDSHFSFNGYSGSGLIKIVGYNSAWTNPRYTLSVTLRNCSKGSTSTYCYMDISATLAYKATVSENSLKGLSNAYIDIKLNSDGGTSTLRINFTYT